MWTNEIDEGSLSILNIACNDTGKYIHRIYVL